MAVGVAIGQLASVVKVKTRAISILVCIKEDVRSIVFVVTIRSARDCECKPHSTHSRAQR